MLNKLSKSAWLPPALLFFFALISFGIYIPRLGLFGDDWIYLYSYHVAGSAGYPAFVAYDRPFSAWIYQLTSTFFAERVWAYHTFLFFLRWLSGVLLWLILTIIWPNKSRQIVSIAILFTIYPAFLQQAIPLEFILHFTTLDAFLLSVYCMMLAFQHPKRWLWFTLAGVVLASCHFSLEYFVGLELARPVILYVLMNRNLEEDQRFPYLRLIKSWLPYLGMLVMFMIWRVFVFKFPSYRPHFFQDFVSAPGEAVREFLSRVIADAKIVFFSSWSQIFQPTGMMVSRLFWVLLAVTFMVSLVSLYLLRRGKKNVGNQTFMPDRWPLIAILTGIFLFFINGWPFWVTKVPLELAFPWDRTMLAFLLASSFWIVGLIDLLFRPKLQPILLAVFFTVSVGFHYFNARVYENEFKAIQQYFWQLSWRIPELKPGTLFVTQDLPLYRESDNDLAGAINWMFAPEHRSVNIPYLMYDFTSRDSSILPVIEPGITVKHAIRSLQYESTTSDILTVYWNETDCVWVLLNDEVQPSGIPAPLRDYIGLSEADQILSQADQARIPPAIFANEPAKGWCYFYQKAEYARQTNNWKEVNRLAEQAELEGFTANNEFEYLPFLEAYVQTGEVEQAYKVSKKIQNNVDYREDVCNIWSKIEPDELDISSESIVNQVKSEFNCNP